MKLYKYLAGLGLAGCMIFPSCMPLLADENTKTAHVEYQVECSYIWNIHADIDFGKNAGVKTTVDRDSNTVSVTKNVIPEGASLNITVTGNGDNGEFSITNGKSEKLSYTVKEKGTNIQTGGTVLSVVSGTNTGSADLDYILFTTQKDAEVAGQYDGNATYEASIVTSHNWVVAEENVERSICNQCGADITGDPWGHLEASNGNCSGYHSEYKTKYICTDCGAVKYE